MSFTVSDVKGFGRQGGHTDRPEHDVQLDGLLVLDGLGYFVAYR